MIRKYWISKFSREWGIVEESSTSLGNNSRRQELTQGMRSGRQLLYSLEELGFLLLDRLEFLMLSKALEEKGISLDFSPMPPNGHVLPLDFQGRKVGPTQPADPEMGVLANAA